MLGFNLSLWQGLWLPKGAAKNIIAKVNAAASGGAKEREHENRKYAFDRSLGGALGRHLDIAILGRREG